MAILTVVIVWKRKPGIGAVDGICHSWPPLGLSTELILLKIHMHGGGKKGNLEGTLAGPEIASEQK